jgi:hypothetical protein
MTCEVCSREFEPKKPNQKVCSAKCRKEKWRRAHAGEEQVAPCAHIPEVGEISDFDSLPSLQAKAGKPIKLTPSVQETVCRMVRDGNYFTIACRAAGISLDALARWRKRGAAGEEPFATFLQALEQAELEAETKLVEIWNSQAPEDWRAARDLLARRFPERWGRIEEALPGVGVGLSITIHLGESDEPKPAIELQQTPER